MRANSRRSVLALLALLLLGAAAASGCAEKPFLSEGDANSAQVGFSRDLVAATEVAKQHCASYEKVPRFLDASANIAYFACENH